MTVWHKKIILVKGARQMRKYKTYSDEFKRMLVAQVDTGLITKAAAGRENNISPSLIDRWRQQIHNGTFRDRPTPREKELERELNRYKKKLAELTMEVELLKKLKSDLAHMKKSNGYIVTRKKPEQLKGDAE